MARFQKNFLETVLILFVCLLLVLDYRGSVLKREQNEAVSRSREDFPSVDPFQHRDVFSKELLGEFFNSSPFRDLK